MQAGPVYLSKSRERNNRSPSSGDIQCHTGDLELIQPSPSDTDRLACVNSSKKQSCVNSILPVQCPAATDRPAGRPQPGGDGFRFASIWSCATSFPSDRRWRRNKISLISLRLSQPTLTPSDYLDASVRAASNPNVPLAPPQLYHYNGRCRHQRMDFHYAASRALRTQIANCSSCRVRTANTTPAFLSCRLQLMRSVRYVDSLSAGVSARGSNCRCERESNYLSSHRQAY